MIPSELIRKKRDGLVLSRDELKSFIDGYLAGSVAEYQMSAFLMAVYFRGMNEEETAVFTDVMLHSGKTVDLSSIPGVKVDKHSTGGVGDKVSLILAPMVAACGVPVPMISGRGLGHTGGTLDKLESIAGFRTDVLLKEYTDFLAEVGCVMIGQTSEIAPADKRMYALRDVTGTIESIPLIAGSIMSKKIAEGIDALVLDVKTGRGAFMETEENAIALAKTLIAVGKRFGKKTVALLTDMSQPLGHSVGNWLEVAECIECMNGKPVVDLMEVTYALGGIMVMLGGKTSTISEGIVKCQDALASGEAFRKFREIVNRQGGNMMLLDHPERYPASAYSAEVMSKSSGYVGSIDALEIGYTGVLIGAGRTKVGDVIDPGAGIILRKKVGDALRQGETIAVIYSNRNEVIVEAQVRVLNAFQLLSLPPKKKPLIRAMIDDEGVHAWGPGFT